MINDCYRNSANNFIFAVSRLNEDEQQILYDDLLSKNLCNEEQITALKTACAIVDMYRNPEKKKILMQIVYEYLTSENKQ